EPGHSVGIRGIAAQEAMLAEQPEFARLDVDVRLVRDRRDLVGVAQDRSLDAVLVGQLGEHPGEGGVTGLDPS
ncbi:MAG TPA: hypothetical protein VMQ65_01130, partial [Candidatus Limnocylindria bacterium]|nr:hypothetical protein [Candidatus Limnocylindria bacterium]